MSWSGFIFIVGVIGIVFLSSFVLSLSPGAAAVQKPSVTEGAMEMTSGKTQSEVVQSPPAGVLAHAAGVPQRQAYIASVDHVASEQAMEIWSHNADDAPHMLFNVFRVTLSDGSQLEQSTGRDVGPGEWLHVTCPLRPGGTGMAVVGFDVELSEPCMFFDYIHDSSFGHQVGI